MTYTDLLTTDSVILNLQASNADEILGQLADALVSQDPSLSGRRDELYAALLDRESRGSTGQQGVGIPHVKMDGVEKVSVVIAVHQQGVDFRALDGEPVHVFFSVVRPMEGADEHLDILRWIAGIASHQDFVGFATQATKPAQIIDLLTELSAV
ncbi:MAG: PTS sugar transporter subunit IIA [Planctomycetes bacterium]|nr:PTS sugar transporter subunit IIA [Planctomycetota bacterium]MBL7009091.1 PTS sugar transporter subunit IIA [Planctomycetota bacterium]